MYNYFKSKEDLLEAIIIEGKDLISIAIEDVKLIEDPVLQLETVFNMLMDMMLSEQMTFWKLYFSILMQPGLPESINKQMQEFAPEAFEMMAETFSKMGVSDPFAEACLFAAAGDGLTIHKWMTGDDYPLERVKKLLLKKFSNIENQDKGEKSEKFTFNNVSFYLYGSKHLRGTKRDRNNSESD